MTNTQFLDTLSFTVEYCGGMSLRITYLINMMPTSPCYTCDQRFYCREYCEKARKWNNAPWDGTWPEAKRGEITALKTFYEKVKNAIDEMPKW